jgi:hypothetical protein
MFYSNRYGHLQRGGGVRKPTTLLGVITIGVVVAALFSPVIWQRFRNEAQPPAPIIQADILLPGSEEVPKFGGREPAPISDNLKDQLSKLGTLDEIVALRERDRVEQQREFEGIRSDPENKFLFFGGLVVWSDTYPLVALSQSDEDMIYFEEAEQGSGITLTAKFFDRDGQLICHIVKNRVILNKPRFEIRTPEPSKLVVYDNAIEVLSVEYINERAIRLLGDFYLGKGTKVDITPKAIHINGSQIVGGPLGKNRKGFVVR